MSGYPNGQPYYSSYNQNPYNAPTQGQQDLQRTSSFDAGDDARFFDQAPGHTRTSTGYTPYGSPPNVPSQQAGYAPAAGNTTTLPYRSGSQNYGLTGYQHQYHTPPSGNMTYNPASYQPQSQYYPPSHGGPQPTYSTGSYQPYVPAAYQDQTANRQTNLHNPYYNTNQQPMYQQPPALPPRPTETAYGAHNANYGAYQHESQPEYPQTYNPAYNTSNSYGPSSPPAAPPPPPPHHGYAAPARSYTHASGPGHNAYDIQSQHSASSLAARPSPDIVRNFSSASHNSHISNQSSSFIPSPQSSLPTPPSRHPSHHSPQRSNTLDRHPQGRQLPGVPSESGSDNDYFIPRTSINTGPSGFEDLMSNLDAAIGSTSTSQHNRDSEQSLDPLFDGPGRTGVSPDEKPTHLNGVVSTGGHNINYGAFANDSDAEAAAGLAAMQAADEQEAAEERRRSDGIFLPGDTSPRQYSSQERSDDSDYAGYDLSLAGGGYAGTISYGAEDVSNYAAAAEAMPAEYNRLNPRMDSVRSTGVSSDGRASQTSGFESIPEGESVHPFPPIRTDVARVDTGGTGGLTEPSSAHPRRLSYEDGDEREMLHQSRSPSRESIPDLFFHPGMSPQRPLPPPPQLPHVDSSNRLPPLVLTGTSPHQNRFSQYDQPPQLYPVASETYQNRSDSPASAVPRSTSLLSTRIPPKPEQPIRSKTDADRAKLQRQTGRSSFQDIYEVTTPATAVSLDLPSIPRKKFNPSKITTEQFKRCSEPWGLSSILSWIRGLADEETYLRESALHEAIVSLFTTKVPTMNTTEAEGLGEKVLKQMLDEGALIKEEEWVKFGSGQMSGVLFQLTGSGCYSPKLHNYSTKGRCYSHHCMRTLKKVDLSLPSERKSEDWVTYYKLTKEDLAKYDKKEVERQNIQHEIVTGETNFIGTLDLLRVLYHDQLQNAQPPIISAKKLPGFLREVFGGAEKIKKVNEDFLLPQLKYRQGEQGPFVVGFSDIFREWIRKARSVYAEYAQNYPRADYLVRKEAERNLLFRNFLEQCRADPRSNRLGWDSFLKGPIQRIQRYGLLLDTVLKNSLKDSDEKINLQFAIDEVKAATHDANQKLADAERKQDLVELADKMKLRKSMEVVELNLDHLGRKIIMRGDLQRASGRGFQMVDTHAILFDHYLVLAKLIVTRGSSGERKHEQYDVSKTPIPMDLVSLESTNDQAVVKSSMKGVTVTTTVAPRGPTPDSRLARTTSTTSGSTLQHTNSGLSGTTAGTTPSMITSTNLDSGYSKDDKVLYPFRVKHLGKADVYTLFATTADVRDQWCQAIISAKQDHAEALYAQNAEPFKLRVLADTAFGIEGYPTGNKGVLIRETPLYRAVQDSEARYVGSGRPAPICRAPVNCATVFQQPYGRHLCAVGTDYGVYISEYNNPRGWTRVITMTRVTQISVLEEFNLFILISDKVLIAYHLDVVCSPTGPLSANNDTPIRKAPQKLSGAKEVGFFVSGKMKDRALVLYKKRDGGNSVFKVLEPVLQKAATTKSRFLPTTSKRGQTDFFREYDEFYIPTECYSINLFHSSLAVSTQRGVEVLTLDKKQPWSVPNLRSESADTQAHLSSIASRIKDLKPLGMFRLSQSEFLVAFEECAVYVNQHGDISRGVVMEFVGRAKSACLHEQYLILCDDDFVEIRDAQNGRLKQVIAGKEMRMLDDGGNLMPGSGQTSATTSNTTPASLGGGINGLGMQGGVHRAAPKTVKLCMQHPEYEKSYVIVELLFATEKA